MHTESTLKEDKGNGGLTIVNIGVDFAMGFCLTAVACKNANRNFIGIEKDEEYFIIAEQRINDTK